jgi:Mrp family chromosome partitioning ATPase
LATILRRDPLSPLEFLPVAAPSEHSAELIGSQALRNLIQVLRLHYDLVILDAAPVLPVADARLLSRLADKAIYVVDWNKTPCEAVKSGIAMLRSAGADVGGTVLNKADMRRHAIYSYGFKQQNEKYGSRYYAE